MPFEYFPLDKAASKLGLSVDEIIHLGAFGEIFICANIYAMANGARRIRINTEREPEKSYFSIRTSQLMPAGIYEVGDEILRHLEMHGDDLVEIDFAYKHDDSGWWETYFDPLIPISRSHLVILSGEIDRYLTQQKRETDESDNPNEEVGSLKWRQNNARKAANARHNKAGGSREKHEKIRKIWATGKYSSRDVCAEQECAALDMSFSAARKALINTPDP